MRRVLLLSAVLLALAAAPVAAQSERITASVGHDRLDFESGEVVDGLEAQELREEVDRQGNGDGRADPDEVAAYENANSRSFADADQDGCFDDFEFVRLNQRAPRELTELRQTLIGAEGPITSTRSIYRGTIFVFSYPATEGAVRVQLDYSQLDDAFGSVYCATGGADWADMWAAWASGEWGSWGGFGQSPQSPGAMISAPGPGADAPTDSGASAAEADSTTYSIEPLIGYSFDPTTVQPRAARALYDGRGLTADTPEKQDILFNNVVVLDVVGGPIQEPFEDWVETAAVVGAIGTGGVALAGVAAVSTEIGRYKFLKLLMAVPLFTRFDKDEVLEHSTRDQLYQYIQNHPGPSFSDLRRELELSNGTLVHHLRILEAQEFVKVIREGFRTRFYVRGPRVIPQAYLTRTQQAILEAIHGNPGVSQKELAGLVGLPRESVFYHTRKLEQVGKLAVQRDGKWRRYFAKDGEGAGTAVTPVPAPL